MKQSKLYIYGLAGLLGYLPIMSYADNAWGGYSGVERRSYPQTPTYQPPAQDRIEYYPETQYGHSYRRESFVVGNELPSEFRSERYVIRDWDSYSLREPPRGRHWVIVDGRYLLVTDDNFRIEIIR